MLIVENLKAGNTLPFERRDLISGSQHPGGERKK
jgi:hypothetical protein